MTNESERALWELAHSIPFMTAVAELAEDESQLLFDRLRAATRTDDRLEAIRCEAQIEIWDEFLQKIKDCADKYKPPQTIL